MSLKLPIKSVEDEVDTRVQVWIRGAAVAQGLLPSVTAESDVFVPGEGKIKWETKKFKLFGCRSLPRGSGELKFKLGA
eukprot:4140752-Amphidinium_carterae.1